MEVSPELQNAPLPILVTESDSVMEVIPVQLRNASSPILVTESGSVMEVSPEQS